MLAARMKKNKKMLKLGERYSAAILFSFRNAVVSDLLRGERKKIVLLVHCRKEVKSK